MILIEQITPALAESVCRKITADLPEYFGLPEANEHYAQGVKTRINFVAKKNEEYLGLISIEFPYPKNANIYWMAILRDFQGQGIGRLLIEAACHFAYQKSARTITVETLSPSESDEGYLKTYHFYKSLGFSPLFNLKPKDYEWSMVYMAKNIEQMISIRDVKNIAIKTLSKSDIPAIVAAFHEVDWLKPTSLIETYFKEQKKSERVVWLAYSDFQLAGYITLKWASQYKPFANQNIPEIMDLNVLPAFRNCGIGGRLLQIAEEKAASQSDIVGIGVGLYGGADGGYGSAQRLYVRSGYLPDGLGATWNYKSAIPGDSYPVDDDLILWFTKKLR
ncbi:MAG: GNAT family N-acetyltransferase [Legionella sp.]|nr:GNAT family N-acetyltransferase [Legionella sp.]